MGAARHFLFGVLGIVLGASGAAVIVAALAAETPPQPPLWAGSEELWSLVSVEPDPAPRSPLVEADSSGSPAVFSAEPEEVDVPVPLSSSEPAAIDIPAIGVHSEMQQVGLTAEHTMEVPAPGPYYDQVAWYKHSATPGAIGPAIIIGHVDSVTGGPSVFFHLADLRPGDEVLVTRRDGTVAVFVVEAVRRYPKADFPTELVYGATDDPVLRLITCGGSFDRADRSYVDNVIAFATFVGSHEAAPSS